MVVVECQKERPSMSCIVNGKIIHMKGWVQRELKVKFFRNKTCF